MDEALLRLRRGSALKRARENAHLTALELVRRTKERTGDAFRLSPSSIYAYESARVLLPDAVARQLAITMGVSLAGLLAAESSGAEPAPAVASQLPAKNPATFDPLERIYLGSRKQPATETLSEHDFPGLLLNLSIATSGDPNQAVRLRSWLLEYDPVEKRLTIRGSNGAAPSDVRLITPNGEPVVWQRDRKDVAQMRTTLDLEAIIDSGNVPSDERLGLEINFHEELSSAELQSLFGLNEKKKPSPNAEGLTPAAYAGEIIDNELDERESKQTATATSPALRDTAAIWELSDFLDSRSARFIVAHFEAGGRNTAAVLSLHEIAGIRDEYQRTLIEAVVRVCLAKEHGPAGPVVDRLLKLAGDDPRRRLGALYLCSRQRWYVDRLDEAVPWLVECHDLALQIGYDLRLAECLIYLGRLSTEYPNQIPLLPASLQDTRSLYERAIKLIDVMRPHRRDLELLAQRGLMILDRTEGHLDDAIRRGDRILEAAGHYQGLGSDFQKILDSVRVDLGIALRRKNTELARQEAELHYEDAIASDRSDSHPGMCLYLSADLEVDRMSEARRQALEAGESDPARFTAKMGEAELHRKNALAKCEKAIELLRPTGDIAAQTKAARRLLFLNTLSLPGSPDYTDAQHARAVREIMVAHTIVGMPRLDGLKAYDPALPALSREELQKLLQDVLSSRLLKLDPHGRPPEVLLDDYLDEDTVLCVGWPVGSSLVVRIFGRHQDRYPNRGCFAIEGYADILRPRLEQAWKQRFVDIDRGRLFDQLQESITPIEPLAAGGSRRAFVVAPEDEIGWLVPLEWLRTVVAGTQSRKSLLETTSEAVIHASAAASPIATGRTRCPQDYTVLATRQPIELADAPANTIYECARQELGQRVRPWPTDRLDNSDGLMILAHLDEAGIANIRSQLRDLDLSGIRTTVLLFCSSAQHSLARGAFAENLALDLRESLGPAGAVLASRVPVSLREALRFGGYLLANAGSDQAIAKLVTKYMLDESGRGPFEVPWVTL